MAAVTWEEKAGMGWRVVLAAAAPDRAFRLSSRSDAIRQPHNLEIFAFEPGTNPPRRSSSIHVSSHYFLLSRLAPGGQGSEVGGNQWTKQTRLPGN